MARFWDAWNRGSLMASGAGGCTCHVGEPHTCEASKTISIPRSEIDEMNSVVNEMACEMRIELYANIRKGNRKVWKSMPPMQLMMEVYYHAGKLQEAVSRGDRGAVREYAADVANMAMMVADASGVFVTPSAFIPAATPEPTPQQEWSGGAMEHSSMKMRY